MMALLAFLSIGNTIILSLGNRTSRFTDMTNSEVASGPACLPSIQAPKPQLVCEMCGKTTDYDAGLDCELCRYSHVCFACCPDEHLYQFYCSKHGGPSVTKRTLTRPPVKPPVKPTAKTTRCAAQSSVSTKRVGRKPSRPYES